MSTPNALRAILFEKPDYIPMTFAINTACWFTYPQEALFDLMESHPFLFPNFRRPKLPYVPQVHPVQDETKDYVDDLGCVWRTSVRGITGTVVGHPLADWDAFETMVWPDPDKSDGLGPVNWDAFRERVKKSELPGGGLRHGHTFLQLCDLRGYQNLMFDMADEDERLPRLIDRLTDFNLELVNRFLDAGVKIMGYAEDLGMQVGPMLSPAHLRKYIVPAYKRLMEPARKKGVIVSMHSDGDIRTLADDLVTSGVQILNLQDLVNGIDWIRDRYAGKLCIELDIDRQDITPYGTPEMIDALIREEVEKLSTPQGGLMMVYGLYPGVPLENIKALMDAMEKYAFYHAG